MKRRKFLTIAGLGTAAVVIPVVGFSSNAFFKQAVTSIVLRNLHFLKLEQSDVNEFANEFLIYVNSFPFKQIQKIKVKTGSEYLLPGSFNRTEILDYIVSNFLLSSDFFIKGMDEQKEVKYIGFYDPYKRPCANPFSHLYYTHQT